MSDETPQNPRRPVPSAPPTQAVGATPPPPGTPPPTAGPPGPWPVAPPPEPPTPSKSGPPALLIVGILALVAVMAVGLALVVTNGDDDGGGSDDTAVTRVPDSTETPDTTAPPATTVPAASAAELARSVVQILATFPDGTCTGSGTIIDESGLILTNSHVITRSEVCPWEELLIATVDTPDLPPQVLFAGVVVADDPALDLAMVRIAERLDGEPVVENFPAIEVGQSATLELGQRLSILGFPGIGGETITFTEGTISGFIEQPGLGVRSWVKTDASIAGGNSGGLAADAEGRIIGVPSRAGTGDIDDITDCRLAADTNGDGTIDGSDSCIPIGGFINGIRPIDAAADIIAEGLAADMPAATVPTTAPPTTAAPTTAPPTTAAPTTAPPTTAPASAASVRNPQFSLQTADGFPDPEVFVIPDGSTQLCLTWEYENVPPGTPYELAWFIDGVFNEGSFASGANQGDASGGFFGCITNETGLPAGRYETLWTVAGTPVLNHSVYVGGGRAPVTIGLQNNTASPICGVSWTPVGSATRGLPRNTATIQPGERFQTTLATGRYQTVVVDCAGAVIFRDPDTEFTSDLTLTLPI